MKYALAPSRLCRALPAALLFALLVAATGCSEAVDPFTHADRYFSLYGYLDPAADTQFVRVVPLRQRIETPPPGPLEAAVTIEERETGRRFSLRDSLVFFPDGSYGHVFFAAFTPAHGRHYRIEVRRPDGAGTWAETVVPTRIRAQIEPPRLATAPTGLVTVQAVRWPGLDAPPHRVEVWYRFGGPRPDRPFQDVPVVYTGRDLGRIEDGAWQVTARLTEDTEDVREEMHLDRAVEFPFALYGVGMRVTVGDSAWRPPGGVWNPEVLIQPGTFSNVEHGFGFFGALGQHTAEWTLAPDVTERLGYPFPRLRAQ